MIKKIYAHFMEDSLYRNSIYLMLSTGVMAFFGFFFWIINARIYSSEQIGIGTTLISVASLIASFSLLGLNVGVVHYLPTSERKNDKINTAFTMVFVAALCLGIGYVAGVHVFSPKLGFLQESVLVGVMFIFLVAALALCTLIDMVFVAYRSTHYVLIKNTILSISKVGLPFLFISFGAFGIFAAFSFSAFIAFVAGLIFLILKFRYSIKPYISLDVVRKMMKFSFGNYLAGFIGMLPLNILPILIINNIGAPTSAYFYISMMIINLLYIIPTATAQSLFAEGSYSEQALGQKLKKAIGIILLIMIPAIIVVFFFGNLVLAAFGESYVREGFPFLRLVALGAISLSISEVGYVLLNIKQKTHYNILLHIVNAVVILGLSYVLLSYHLVGIGFAWIIGQAITAILYLFLLRKVFA